MIKSPQSSRPLLAFLMLAIQFSQAAGPAASEATTTLSQGEVLDLTPYTMTFNDDFSSLDVSAWGPNTKWIAHTPWNGDFGDAKFVDPKPGFPFTVKDGILSIEARKSPDGKWQSGLLASVDPKGNGFSQKGGYFEMRAKLPAGSALWPAFWLIGLDRSTHTSEIDVLEHNGHFPEKYSSAVHVWDRKIPKQSASQKHAKPVPSGTLYSDYNTYGVDVGSEWIRFYFNRHEYWRVRKPAQHDQPFYILLNLGLGSGWPIENAPSPAFMQIDYVRAWALKENEQAKTGDARN